MRAPLLEVRELSVAYGKVEAVHHVSLSMQEGSIVTVIGPNGAGKTTLLGAVMGLLPSRGAVSYQGEPVERLTVEQRVGRGLMLVPESRELFAGMSVADNLELGAFARRRHGDAEATRTLADVYARFPRLAQRRSQMAGTLSGGERQMLALGRALMGKPRLLMLDEPSLGLAPLIVREIFSIVAELRSTGVSILLVEQNARAALQVADYGYVLETGDLAVARPVCGPRVRSEGGRHLPRRGGGPALSPGAGGPTCTLLPSNRLAKPRRPMPKDPVPVVLADAEHELLAPAGARPARARPRARVDPHPRRGLRRPLFPALALRELEPRGGHRQVGHVLDRPRRRRARRHRRAPGVRVLRRHVAARRSTRPPSRYARSGARGSRPSRR